MRTVRAAIQHANVGRAGAVAAALISMAGTVMLLTGPGASMASASSVARATVNVRASTPSLTLSLPAAVSAGTQVLAIGGVRRAPHGATVVLQRRDGKKWVGLGRAAIEHHRYKVSFAAPRAAATLNVRAIIVKGPRRVATSRTHRLTVHSSAHAVKGFLPNGHGPLAPPASGAPAASSTPASAEPTPSEPITVTAPAVTVALGSVVYVDTPSPVTSLTSVEASSGASSGVSVALENGALGVAASTTTTPGQTTITARTLGCTNFGCNQHIAIEIPVTVRGIAAPAGKLESVTTPSPERAAQAERHRLVDELVVTVGSADDPGTREQAEAAARTVQGVVSGGIEGSGIYQIRWASRQDLDARRAQLEAIGSVTSVSYSSVENYGPTETYPVAPQFDNTDLTWPYQQVHAPEAWLQTTGSNVTVGVIDVADVYRDHEDLNVAETLGPYVPPLASGVSDAAHPSHVAGLACARNNTAENEGPQLGMVGIAWGCPIVSAATSSISSDAMLNIMQEMARKPSVRVVNISLGHNVPEHTEPDGISTRCANEGWLKSIEEEDQGEAPQFLAFLGGPEGRKIVWVTAAGNDCAPLAANAWGAAGGALRNVITVAATDSNEALAAFSDYGPGVKVAAPGGYALSPSGGTAETDGLMSSVPGECSFLLIFETECSKYEEMAGTSMASPIVAGATALVVSKNPGISAEEAATCVTGSAGAAGSPGTSDFTSGRSDVLPSGYNYTPVLPEGSTIPIVNAAAAAECKHRHTAASFRGSGGGDGWALALSGSAVFNVFHHSLGPHGRLPLPGHRRTVLGARDDHRCRARQLRDLRSTGTLARSEHRQAVRIRDPNIRRHRRSRLHRHQRRIR